MSAPSFGPEEGHPAFQGFGLKWSRLFRTGAFDASQKLAYSDGGFLSFLPLQRRVG